MVTVEVVLSRIQVPAANLFAIDTMEIIVADVTAPVVLR
jgi:hypothetical protein